jgi:hypothetical protein
MSLKALGPRARVSIEKIAQSPDGHRLELPPGWMRCIRRSDGRRMYAVPSRSVPGQWHLTNLEECSCKAYRFRGTCSHLAAVRRFVIQARHTAAS